MLLSRSGLRYTENVIIIEATTHSIKSHLMITTLKSHATKYPKKVVKTDINAHTLSSGNRVTLQKYKLLVVYYWYNTTVIESSEKHVIHNIQDLHDTTQDTHQAWQTFRFCSHWRS